MTNTEVPVPATETVIRSALTTTQRRRMAKGQALTARLRLLEVAKKLDGDLATLHQNALAAMTAIDDVVDGLDAAEALDRDTESDRLREWGKTHNESRDELQAEAGGEL